MIFSGLTAAASISDSLYKETGVLNIFVYVICYDFYF